MLCIRQLYCFFNNKGLAGSFAPGTFGRGADTVTGEGAFSEQGPGLCASPARRGTLRASTPPGGPWAAEQEDEGR